MYIGGTKENIYVFLHISIEEIMTLGCVKDFFFLSFFFVILRVLHEKQIFFLTLITQYNMLQCKEEICMYERIDFLFYSEQVFYELYYRIKHNRSRFLRVLIYVNGVGR